jgi:hypothetical protein
MSGTMPTTNYVTLNWKSNNNIIKTETVTNKMFTKDLGGHYWSFTLKSPPLTRTDFQPVWAFLTSQKGSFDTFTIVPPVINDTSGTFANANNIKLPVTSSAAVGASSVSVTPVGSGTLKAGDIIKFSNHSKVYMLTADTTFVNTTPNTLSIFPALLTAQAGTGTTYVITENVPLNVRMMNDIQTYNTDTDGYYEYEIDLREAL